MTAQTGARVGEGVSSRSVVLIGFMGAGKSAVGRALAARLEVPFVDTDDLIVEQFGPIATLFAERGEAGFRAVEQGVVTAVLDEAFELPCVVALGGGAVTIADVRVALTRHAHVAWLSASLEVLRARVGTHDTVRPLAVDPERFARQYGEREPLYAAACSARFENDGTQELPGLVAQLAAWARLAKASAERAV